MKPILYRLLSTRGFKFIQLWLLMHTTARAFDVRMPAMKRDLLVQYATFTAKQAERALVRGESLSDIQEALYSEAYALGNRVRCFLRLRDDRDCLELLAILYRNIGITLVGQLPGKITISHCFFSSFYTPEVCRLISYMDWGIFAGLCGGGRLTFSERITEGCGVCRACFDH